MRQVDSSIVMLSAGLDSTVNLAIARSTTTIVACVTFDYGQKAARSETAASKRLAAHFEVPHIVIDLPWLASRRSALTGHDEIPEPGSSSLDDAAASESAAEAVWVPNRNGVFVSIAAALAEEQGAGAVIGGFNAEEGATFPDNTPAFMDAATRMFSFSTRNGVRVESFTADLDKTEIVRLGVEYGVPFEMIWSCYRDGETMCGRCESCMRLRRAVNAVDASLPVRMG